MSPAAQAVLRDAVLLSVQLRSRGDKIIARPSSALTPELADSIRQHRADLILLLAMAVPPPNAQCYVCRGRRYFARPERIKWICGTCHPPLDESAVLWHEVLEHEPPPQPVARR